MTAPSAAIAADPGRKRMEEALREIAGRLGKTLYHTEPWVLSDLRNAYEVGSMDAHEECAKIARAALGEVGGQEEG